jgi:hypothetical protein
MQAVVVVFRFPPYLSMNAIIILPPSSSKVRLQELNYFTTTISPHKQCSVRAVQRSAAAAVVIIVSK